MADTAERIIGGQRIFPEDRAEVMARMAALVGDFQYADVSLINTNGNVMIPAEGWTGTRR